jgi:tetratricopeptide (TPR) repeat protein
MRVARWICIALLRYQVEMNRKQRRGARLGTQIREVGRSTPIVGWFNAALAHQRAGRAGDAERLCRNILALEPGHAQTLHLLGLIEHQRGHSDAAIDRIRMAIARNGRDPAFHHNLGNILRTQGRAAEAAECYERALSLDPASVDTLYNLGNTCLGLGRRERAVTYFEQALRLKPDAIELHNNLGGVLHDLGRYEEAIACYRKALERRPEAIETLDNLAVALRAQGQLDEAQACYERALAVCPDHVESLIGRGAVLRDRGVPAEAVAFYERSLALAPDHPEARNNLGVALVDLGRLQEAVSQYERVLARQPTRAETHSNLGVALQRQGHYAAALACYERALALRPDYAQAHFNRAIVSLLTGEFDNGWEEYEWRFAVARYDRHFDRPLWSGERLDGKTILVHAEQGFGDTLQFVRYIPAVAERGGTVVLEVPEPLLRIARTVAGVSQIIAAGDPLPPVDCHCPLLSLPKVFKTELATIPSTVPYLSPPADAAATWAARIGEAPGFKVGLVWAGTSAGALELRLFQQMFEVAAVSWFSLQVGDNSSDISSFDSVKISDLSPWLVDFAETAAAVCQLDLVISVATSVAHLAGALGRPIWILLPYAAEWRWLLRREDSPWYPTARLFRQRSPGDWLGVAHEITAALAEVARAGSARGQATVA